ncbi:hypothetical protein D5R81_00080 [Parashewanella spongiae]|uniref:Uncharacterized protein n=2 Tax=Parashewanella spongiae TaxID=342950 RepID=A0A3A6TYD4_9GAMM|nr:hypothetical protein [Parashewanella spongiae]MCL1076582.1 hypothetical protein [Parashewanella spongiae]RJY19540.1 hypothetical protein D5R81_00080 [Parashewanella spongiae]
MLNNRELYSRVMAMESRHFNVCFYCGCIATEYDFIPPLKLAEFYIRTGEEADFYEIPACNECFNLLKEDKSGLLGQRVDFVKSKLAKKYEKALRVYHLWHKDELDDFDHNFKKSLNAGIELGTETYERIKFKGFEFEVDGQKRHSNFVQTEKLSVFGETFDNFRDALDYASKSYRVPKAKLKELFAKHNNSFDKAITAFQQEMEQRLFEKKCREFAKANKQNSNFIIRTVKLYMKNEKDLTVDEALEKIYKNYIAPVTHSFSEL